MPAISRGLRKARAPPPESGSERNPIPEGSQPGPKHPTRLVIPCPPASLQDAEMNSPGYRWCRRVSSTTGYRSEPSGFAHAHPGGMSAISRARTESDPGGIVNGSRVTSRHSTFGILASTARARICSAAFAHIAGWRWTPPCNRARPLQLPVPPASFRRHDAPYTTPDPSPHPICVSGTFDPRN
jgi:hypothetical protein